MQSRVLKRFARFESDWTFRESVISLIYHQRTANAKTTNRSFLDVIFMSEKKNPMGTVQKRFLGKSHLFIYLRYINASWHT